MGRARPWAASRAAAGSWSMTTIALALVRAREEDNGVVNTAYSIGLWLREDGSITDTVEGMPAAQAGIGPGMKVIAINGKKFSPGRPAGRAAARQERFRCARIAGRKHGILQDLQGRLSRRRKISAPGAGRKQTRLADGYYQAPLAVVSQSGFVRVFLTTDDRRLS